MFRDGLTWEDRYYMTWEERRLHMEQQRQDYKRRKLDKLVRNIKSPALPKTED